MTGDDPIRRKTTTKRGCTITVCDSHKIGYVRFVINGVFQCERLDPESRPFKFGLYDEEKGEQGKQAQQPIADVWGGAGAINQDRARVE